MRFTGSSFFNTLKLSDILFLLPTSICVIFSIQTFNDYLKEKNGEIEGNEDTLDGFTIDEPTLINGNNDYFSRGKFIEQIANKIKNTRTKKGSFAIGIVAKWGTGKTTFINTLLDKLSGKDVTKIELNVWKCNNNTQIIETLFKELRKSLRQYSFTIDNKLKDYTLNLIKGTKSESLNVIKNLTEIIVSDASLAEQYESINKEIQRINKKIVVVFDDMDRLDKKEIYEVIRLIRNTANFSNTFFVVAYDRTYLLNAIQEINGYQTHYFLEKIFQVEFTLPPIPENILERELRLRIEPFLTAIGKQGYNKLKERGHLFLEYGNADITSLFIHNMRDIVRFVNSFKLSYEFVKDEVYFPDFYSLELIRFKHPDLFSMVYKERNSIFTTGDDENSSGSKYQYSLTRVSKEEKNAGELILRRFIEKNKQDLKLNDKDVDVVCSAFASVFPDPNRLLRDSRKEVENYHLSAIIPSMFDRYFFLGIDGKLSEIEFSKIRQFPYDDFIQKINKLISTDELKYEVIRRLEHIRQFDNRDDFEKILKAILYVGNMKVEKTSNPMHNYVGFDSKLVASLLGDEFYLKRYYTNNREDYKNFIVRLLTTDTSEYNFTNIFLNFILRDGFYSISEILNANEISNILLSNLQNALNKTITFSKDIWWYFLHCNIRIEIAQSNNSWTINYEKNDKAKRLLKKFVWYNDLDNFINYTISKSTPFEPEYKSNNVIPDIFGSVDFFVRAIKITKKTSPEIQEFLRYYDVVTTQDEFKKGVPRDFFKVLKPQWE